MQQQILECCKVLSPRKIKALWKKWKTTGDQQAYQELVFSQLRLAFQIADSFRNFRYVKDLKSEAILAVLEAISFWDPKRGRLSTLTTLIVKQRLARFLQQNSHVIKVPYGVLKKIHDLEQEGEKLPDDLAKVKNIRDNSFFLPKDKTFDLEEVIQNNESGLDELKEQLYKSIESLEGKKKIFIKEYYGIGCEPKTLKELSMKYNLSTPKVKSILKLGLEELRRKMREFEDAEN